MMPLLAPLFNYCERTAIGLFNEPLNAVSNIAFFIAAWLLWRNYKNSDRQSQALIFLVALVGIGSTLFHTFANQLTMVADITPITLFTLYYLWLALRRLANCSRLITGGFLLLFTVTAVAADRIPDPYRFNGSVSYFPCLAALVLLALCLRTRRHPAALGLFKAATVFAISLTFRSIDMVLCQQLAIGTHFIWHTLNGAVLYLLTSTVIGVNYKSHSLGGYHGQE